MEIKTKYGLGDKVWSGIFLSSSVKEPCKLCNGVGRIPVAEYTVQCPAPQCYSGQVTTASRDWRLESQRLTIGQVRAQIDKKASEITYMCKETGVGSGRIWAECKLFPSEEALLQQAEEIREKGFPDVGTVVDVEEQDD